MKYIVEIAYSGHVSGEIEAESKEDAEAEAYLKFENTDEREIVANIDDISVVNCERMYEDN